MKKKKGKGIVSRVIYRFILELRCVRDSSQVDTSNIIQCCLITIHKYLVATMYRLLLDCLLTSLFLTFKKGTPFHIMIRF